MREVIDAWDAAGQRPDARAAIHPLGVDDEDYERSGEALATALRRVIGPAELVVDFGCGDGRVTIPLARYFPRVIGVDASPAMLDRLRARAPHLEHRLTAGADLDGLADVDAIICLAVLIHHRHADGAAIINGLARALRPGGLLILDLPLYEYPRDPGNWTDVAAWTLWELTHVADVADLDVVQAHENAGAFRWDGTHPLITLTKR